jgi:hypothetical protein
MFLHKIYTSLHLQLKEMKIEEPSYVFSLLFSTSVQRKEIQYHQPAPFM